MVYTLVNLSLWILFTVQLSSCDSNVQSNQQIKPETRLQASGKVGGPCDTCELMYIDLPNTVNEVDTSLAWHGKGKKLIITGNVYKSDKKTPASDIIIYYWQTDEQGLYADHPNLNPKAKRHGYVRGWLKTNQQGKYTIYTIRPAPYPVTKIPAHIHLLIKEPNLKNEYYIDNVEFDNDPLLTPEVRRQRSNKAGNGIVSVRTKDGVMSVTRDIILGLNIENYPK